MKIAVLLVNGYFLLGMGDCNGGGVARLQGSFSAGPTLSALTLSAGLLNPSFEPNVTSYDTMYIGDTSVTVTPTAADVGTTITVNGTLVTSGNASGAIALPSGNTAITVTLTANGVSNTYTITAHRLAQQAYVKASNQGTGDELGFSVALDGDTLVVGARREAGNGTGVNPAHNNLASNAGAAYVFARNGTTWAQQAYLKASNTGADDWFGYSVAISGDTIAVGAMNEDGSATGVNGADNDGTADSGAVYIFTRSGTTWSHQAYVKASNAGNTDQFGRTVALSGDTLAVGAAGEDSNLTGVTAGSPNEGATGNGSSDSGAVYVFTRSGTTWSQQAYVKASNTGAGDNFGYSVAIDGETLGVGARGEESNAVGINGNQANDSMSFAGAVYVFTRSGTTWTQQAYVKASNTGTGDRFGSSIALSGDTLAVGAPTEDGNGTGANPPDSGTIVDSGAAYVFTRSGTTWSQQAYIKTSNTGGLDQFGWKVALDGDTLIVSAANEQVTIDLGEDSVATGINGNQSDNSATDSGAAYVFRRVSTTWSQQAYVKASNTGSDDEFAHSVAVSGDTIAVGAHLEDSNATTINPGAGAEADNSAGNSGAVYVFQ
ncbi:MAG: cadherin-like beta sandwich domain-containing protein [Nitrospira sp.]|nr:cadherin-like beta sandwich domain-containing protein [Nitrospira sp.]